MSLIDLVLLLLLILFYFCGHHLVAIIRPTTEFHDAGLFVKREIFYINFARRFVDRRWLPFDQPVVVDSGFGGQRHFEVPIRTEHINIIWLLLQRLWQSLSLHTSF